MKAAQPLYRIHLDPIGGIAGDMFVAALADTFPELVAGLLTEVNKLPLPPGATIRVIDHRDAVLNGRRFEVHAPLPPAAHQHDHPHGNGKHGAHTHSNYESIRRILRETPLREPVRKHALGLFALLAEAEAAIHCISLEEVVFHEVGAWDSIVDFVAAAYFIDALSPAQWTCSAIPLGGGRVLCQHGVLPVPAPATTLLLRGMQVVDDGVQGERVTPTGAAILKYLVPGDKAARAPTTFVMGPTGNGFGLKVFPGFSNVLRCIAYTRPDPDYAVGDEEISVATFEIDDQTAEDLAIALDRIRQAPGVLEVYQAPVFGKKGRMTVQVQILLRPENVDAVAELCFAETSTLGLRFARVARKTVSRSTISLQEPRVRVKLARRPGGALTAKAELDDLAGLQGGKSERDKARRSAESKAIDKESS